MRQFRLDGTGTIEGIKPVEAEKPQLGPRDVLVRMRAASLNYLDLKILQGHFPGAREKLVPLSDGAGEVVEAGAGTRRFRVGDRVASTFFPRWIGGPIPADARAEQPGGTVDGVLSEFVLFHEDAVVSCPAGLSFEEASTLPCAALTAWQLFTGARALLPGELVLLQGTGGVSLFALQFARAAGARIIAVTSSSAKAERLKAMGADTVIDRTQILEWGREVKHVTGGKGADHVMEIGEAGTLEQSIIAAATGAQINLVGRPVGAPPVDPAILMRGIVTYRRISVGSRDHFEAMNRAIEFHAIRPVIDRVFEAGQVHEAFAYFSSRGHLGKVVVRV